MKKIISFTVLLAAAGFASGQDLFEYDHPVAIDSQLVARGAGERAAQRYAHIGAYRRALELYDSDFTTDKSWEDRNRMPRQLSAADRAHFETFRPVDATEYLTEKARRRQVVMFNETHHSPQHRAYVRSLLDEFYRAGYRYLALEALSPYDTLLNERGYPTLKSGYYVREPQMANLIREALAQGYTLVAYENTGKERERDHQQALNIKAVLDDDPEARILVLCGFHHLTESPVDPATNRGKSRWMAGWFKEITGIDPFTVNQVVLSERSTADAAAPYYPLIRENDPALFVNSEGDLFNGPEGTELFDALLYHPPATYVDNRPRWLLWDEKSRLFRPDLSAVSIEFPVMLRAYRQSELTESLLAPVDIIMLDDPTDETPLVLRPGAYVLVAENAYGDAEQMEVVVGRE